MGHVVGPRGKGNAIALELGKRVIGQDAAIAGIVPYVRMFQAGLAPEGRPAGIFLLLGPTGTGKTRTVEALGEVIHGYGRSKGVLRIDCGEFQMEHEVAKLIGAPPGYLGHRETTPILTQQRLLAVTSDRSALSIVLFDEIEKAAPSMVRILLGVLDKGRLRLGDNTEVNFERSLIFMTSNLGARQMANEAHPAFGFGGPDPANLANRLEKIGAAAANKKFSPEFMNRIDAVITYKPLTASALSEILDIEFARLQHLIIERMGPRRFRLDLARNARRYLLERGASSQYGARELKRALHRFVMQPIADLVADGEIEPGSIVRVEAGASSLRLRTMRAALRPAA